MKYCGNCGKKLNDEDEVCPYCSAEFTEYSPEKEVEIIGNKKKKRFPKKAKIVCGVIILIIVAVVILNSTGFVSDFKKGYNEAVTEAETTEQNTYENSDAESDIMPAATETLDTAAVSDTTAEDNSYVVIDIMDLFESLEKAEEILGAETSSIMDVEAYEQHTFGNVKILCVYDTDRVYKVTVEYDSAEAKNKYKLGKIDGNTTLDKWEAELGHTVYEGYNYEEDYVRAYSKEIDGSLYYIEIIANADTPKAISVYVS